MSTYDGAYSNKPVSHIPPDWALLCSCDDGRPNKFCSCQETESTKKVQLEEVETIEERLEFNRLWWSSVQEGEQVTQDEIEEVRWMIEELKRMTK